MAYTIWHDLAYVAYKIIKSAIHVARLTIHEVGVRNPNNFSDKLVENWR